MSSKIKNIAFWIMVSIVILLCVYLFIYIRSESYDCMMSPLVYGISKVETTVGEFICSCSSPNTEPIRISKDGISQWNYYP